MKRKIWLSALLSLTLILALLPMGVLAGDSEVTVNNGMTFSASTTNADIEATWGPGTASITANADGSYTVTLEKDIVLKKGAVNPVSFGVYNQGAEQPRMILDLNGHTLSGQTIVVSNMGNLTIRDSGAGGSILYNGGQYLVAVQNAGYSLTVESGTIECQGAGSASYNAAVSTTVGAETVINGGILNGNGAGAILSYGTTIINNGELNGTYGAVSKQSSSGTGSILFPGRFLRCGQRHIHGSCGTWKRQ